MVTHFGFGVYLCSLCRCAVCRRRSSAWSPRRQLPVASSYESDDGACSNGTQQQRRLHRAASFGRSFRRFGCPMSSSNHSASMPGDASHKGPRMTGGGRHRAKKAGNNEGLAGPPPGFSSHESSSKNAQTNHPRTTSPRSIRSKSPKNAGSRSPMTHFAHGRRSPMTKSHSPADMTVIVNRVDLWDCPSKGLGHEDKDHPPHIHQHHHGNHSVAPYHFAPDVSCWVSPDFTPTSAISHSVTVVRAPNNSTLKSQQELPLLDVIDTSIPNPYRSEVVHDKYWSQRRRLFSRFDMGIQLDAEGWFSVTPEIIANHVARCVAELSNSSAFRRGLPGSNINDTQGIVVLDAFCGCGGNAIAFGKVPHDMISLVVCVDIDRTKLRKAAYNASLYGIPAHKLVFVECNTMFVLGQCYSDGDLVLDRLTMNDMTNAPSPVETEVYAGYMLGGVNLLPSRIDAVFMDPPWGGVDYFRLKNGYDLEKHMRIRVGPVHKSQPPIKAPEYPGALADDFFDSFSTQPSQHKNVAPFNEAPTDGEYVNGVDLLRMAAGATKSRLVVYDLPRNTNKTSLGESALAAGYRGNMKLDEHYLNGRIKTVTAYLGADYSSLLV